MRTPCGQLWENNPHLTPLEDQDGRARQLDCQYPLIHCSNTHPWHFIHDFTQFISEKIGVPIRPGPFKGDSHLSELEKNWISQV